MQTELAQIISLTSYGNNYLRSGQIPEDYFPNSTVFLFCNKVDFRNLEGSPPNQTETIVADNPCDWFGLLKKEGCIQIRLYYRPAEDTKTGPEYNMVGFVGGGGNWMIETNFGSYSYYWYKRWQLGDRNAPDKKIWLINYGRTLQRYTPANQQLNIEELRAKFVVTLRELTGFCTQQQLSNWKDVFEKAEQLLSDPAPNKQYYHYDMIVVQNYSLQAQQLLFSAASAWVFGGMGSWNDMGFSDNKVQEEYQRLSGQLYDQIIQCILGATNSF